MNNANGIQESWNKSFKTFLESQKMKALLTIDQNNLDEEQTSKIFNYLMSFTLKDGAINKEGKLDITFGTSGGNVGFIGPLDSEISWYWSVSIQSLSYFSGLDKTFLQESFCRFPFDQYVHELHELQDTKLVEQLKLEI